jgi:hypothetical protein
MTPDTSAWIGWTLTTTCGASARPVPGKPSTAAATTQIVANEYLIARPR